MGVLPILSCRPFARAVVACVAPVRPPSQTVAEDAPKQAHPQSQSRNVQVRRWLGDSDLELCRVYLIATSGILFVAGLRTGGRRILRVGFVVRRSVPFFVQLPRFYVTACQLRVHKRPSHLGTNRSECGCHRCCARGRAYVCSLRLCRATSSSSLMSRAAIMMPGSRLTESSFRGDRADAAVL